MDEQVFFDQGTVKVTNARFIVGNQTYAMNGVTSVASGVTPPKRGLLIIGLVIGLLMLIGGDGGTKFVGLLIAAGCGFALYKQQATHAVILHSASGEVRALSDTDEGLISGVVAALNSAIIHRG
jgi:predicted ATPase